MAAGSRPTSAMIGKASIGPPGGHISNALLSVALIAALALTLGKNNAIGQCTHRAENLFQEFGSPKKKNHANISKAETWRNSEPPLHNSAEKIAGFDLVVRDCTAARRSRIPR